MSGIYIHIPFCRQACNYCNFHFATSLSKKEAMLVAINKEIVLTAEDGKWLVNTIYFGGGTPSLMEVEEIATILNTIQSVYKVDGGAEITLEANPDDLTEEKLKGWRAAGINRLSIGVQSFLKKT
ncbi:radical SAM protein [Niabella hibiscisoli]|uniref:radical SAM protein n=1 Tax=Niabella hibiscisoli TaxID=1825928 RepID=UPI001F0D2358|nr:radical SAM protein [Niabella hibiscisoli]MCH5717593.1 radical SAM protein [Niabella hibiscisoli]